MAPKWDMYTVQPTKHFFTNKLTTKQRWTSLQALQKTDKDVLLKTEDDSV